MYNSFRLHLLKSIKIYFDSDQAQRWEKLRFIQNIFFGINNVNRFLINIENSDFTFA